MAENALNVEIREGAGKGVARKLRAAGRIPGVCYGKGDAPLSIHLDAKALRRLLETSDAGMNTLITLQGGATQGKVVLLRELQRDPIRGQYLHADFLALDMTQTVEVSVPIHLSGYAAGVEAGGILDQALRELDLECLPTAIPREIVVDVAPLNLGDSIHVRDIALPEGVTLRSDPDLSVVSVVAPAKEEEPVAEDVAAEGAAAEGEGEAADKDEKGDGASEGGDEKKD